MCLILFSWDSHPKYKLIVAANRDEFYDRPTTPLMEWEDDSNVVAGKDLTAGGTWMGVNKNGRFTALTNYRDIANIKKEAPSRGDLTKEFLLENISAIDFFSKFESHLSDYNGFNLLNGTFNELTYFNNQEKTFRILEPGVYGLSNAFLDTKWPKVVRAKEMFSEIVSSQDPTDKDLINFLNDKKPAGDQELPKTGLSYEMEKLVSSIYIDSEKYGTCCTTVLKVDYDGNGTISEQSYPVGNRTDQIVSFNFKWDTNAKTQ